MTLAQAHEFSCQFGLAGKRQFVLQAALAWTRQTSLVLYLLMTAWLLQGSPLTT
jgi:hypothetical protein